MSNPYPRGTLSHDLWEFGEAKRLLGEAVRDTWAYRALEGFVAWLSEKIG